MAHQPMQMQKGETETARIELLDSVQILSCAAMLLCCGLGLYSLYNLLQLFLHASAMSFSQLGGL